jgi:hypothetical protein
MHFGEAASLVCFDFERKVGTAVIRSMVGRATWLASLLLALSVADVARAQSTADTVSSDASSAASGGSSGSSSQVTNFWTCLAKVPPALAACKAQFCASCCGQMLNSMLAPITYMTGGCVRCCPAMPNKDQLADQGPAGACAQITKDTLEAKARLDAVRCLATVDCNYWPEAEKGLINALRADKNEAVRYGAALALCNGCCTKNTMEALKISASGSDKDGNPRESSPRVRQAALIALNKCECKYEEPIPSRPAEPPMPAEPPVPVVPSNPGVPVGPVSAPIPLPQASSAPAGKPAPTTAASTPRPAAAPKNQAKGIAGGRKGVREVATRPTYLPPKGDRSLGSMVSAAWSGKSAPAPQPTTPVETRTVQLARKEGLFGRLSASR